jgi:hypothetical protein
MTQPVRTLLTWEGSTVPLVAAGALEIDAASMLGFESSAEVTEHPVETGSAVADHVRPLNGTITLEGVITNAPIALPATQMNGATLAPGVVTLPDGSRATALRFSGAFDRVRACDETLRGLVEAGAIVSITTGLRTVNSLAITRYRPERTGETGDAIKIVLEFKRVRLATTARAPVPAVRRAQVRLDRGAQPADNRSFLARVLDGGAPATAARARASGS